MTGTAAAAAALVALILFGTTARLTRLITADTITAPLRAALIRRVGPRSRWVEWVRCPWCVGLWLAAAVTLVAWCAERLLLDAPLLPVPGWLWVPGLALTNNYLAARWQT